jgi:hypothetical protein
MPPFAQQPFDAFGVSRSSRGRIVRRIKTDPHQMTEACAHQGQGCRWQGIGKDGLDVALQMPDIAGAEQVDIHTGFMTRIAMSRHSFAVMEDRPCRSPWPQDVGPVLAED